MSLTKSLSGLVLFVGLLGPTAALSQKAPADDQQLIAADRGLLEAMSGPHPNIDRFGSALAPDYIDMEFGAAHSRDEVLRQLHGLSDFSFQYENPHAVMLSPTSGYVIAEVTYSAALGGAAAQSRVLTTTVFSHETGRWLAHLHVEMKMKPSGAAALTVPDSDPTLLALRKRAAEVEAEVHIGSSHPFPPPHIALNAGTRISFFSDGDDTVHEAQFSDLPGPMQAIWNQWAGYTTDQSSGKALFEDMFYRFFFVHELGHWMTSQVIAGLPDSERKAVAQNDAGLEWDNEIAANRISVAWFREHEPQYLAKLTADFRRILAHLPDPVPPGTDQKTYFNANYDKLGADPMAYGWYQLQMVLLVYDEPIRSFQQVLDALPKTRLKESAQVSGHATVWP